MVFAIPLEDGTFGIAQAIDSMLENVIYVAIFSNRYEALPKNINHLDKDAVISLNATWKQDLNNGTWAKICVLPPVVKKSDFPNEKFAHNGYIGAKHSSAGLFNDFLSAFHGIVPWNVMANEMYWDEYLNNGNGRPNTARLLSPQERVQYRKEVMGINNA